MTSYADIVPSIEDIIEITMSGSEAPHDWMLMVINNLTDVDECPAIAGKTCGFCNSVLSCPVGKKTYGLLYSFKSEGQTPKTPTLVIGAFPEEEFQAAFVKYAVGPLIKPIRIGSARYALCRAMEKWAKQDREVLKMMEGSGLKLED